MKKISFAISVFILLISLLSCSNFSHNKGNCISVVLPSVNGKSSVSRQVSVPSTVFFKISCASENQDSDIQEKTGSSGDKIVFNELDAGLYHITGLAFQNEKMEVLLFKGEADAVVSEGEETKVALVLKAVSENPSDDKVNTGGNGQVIIDGNSGNTGGTGEVAIGGGTGGSGGSVNTGGTGDVIIGDGGSGGTGTVGGGESGGTGGTGTGSGGSTGDDKEVTGDVTLDGGDGYSQENSVTITEKEIEASFLSDYFDVLTVLVKEIGTSQEKNLNTLLDDGYRITVGSYSVTKETSANERNEIIANVAGYVPVSIFKEEKNICSFKANIGFEGISVAFACDSGSGSDIAGESLDIDDFASLDVFPMYSAYYSYDEDTGEMLNKYFLLEDSITYYELSGSSKSITLKDELSVRWEVTFNLNNDTKITSEDFLFSFETVDSSIIKFPVEIYCKVECTEYFGDDPFEHIYQIKNDGSVTSVY